MEQNEETLSSKEAALEALKKLSVIDTSKVGGVELETRLIGNFAPEVGKRNPLALQKLIDTQSNLQDLLTIEDNSPSTTFDSENGQITITTRKSIFG